MKELFKRTGQDRRHCLLNCGCDEDSVDHYIVCNSYWDFITSRRPRGLGIDGAARNRDTALLLSNALSDEDVVRLALGLYALYRTVNFIRFGCDAYMDVDTQKLLQLFAKHATHNSFTKQLLKY